MADFIVILLVLLVIGAAVRYIVKEKKKGSACIGCSCAGTCGKKHCSGNNKKDNSKNNV